MVDPPNERSLEQCREIILIYLRLESLNERPLKGTTERYHCYLSLQSSPPLGTSRELCVIYH